jgi:uncharacterized protein HemX
MVQIALVQHNESLFQSAISDTKKWLEQHFVKNDASGNLSEELDKFSAVKIHGQFPDISLSLKMIKDISKLRIEGDKAEQPAETKKPVEDVKAVETIKPTKPMPATEAAPAKR